MEKILKEIKKLLVVLIAIAILLGLCALANWLGEVVPMKLIAGLMYVGLGIGILYLIKEVIE